MLLDRLTIELFALLIGIVVDPSLYHHASVEGFVILTLANRTGKTTTRGTLLSRGYFCVGCLLLIHTTRDVTALEVRKVFFIALREDLTVLARILVSSKVLR